MARSYAEPQAVLRESVSGEMRVAPVHESLRCFAVVVGQPGADVVSGLDVHAFAELAVDGAVEVFFHVAVREPRSVGEAPGSLAYLGLEAGRREHRVDDAQ